MKKEKISSGKLYKIFVYVALITLAISIIVPVVWVFMSSLKTNAEFQGSPWSLPASFYIQNFLDAFEKANMAEYFLNSVIVTALGLLLLVIIADVYKRQRSRRDTLLRLHPNHQSHLRQLSPCG